MRTLKVYHLSKSGGGGGEPVYMVIDGEDRASVLESAKRMASEGWLLDGGIQATSTDDGRVFYSQGLRRLTLTA